MAAVCGYRNGDFNSPVACSPGAGCVQWGTPAVFGCTSGSNTILHTTCVDAAEQIPSWTAGILACSSDAPYCATISLYWNEFYYTNWQCATRAGLTAEILAVATITGPGPAATHYLTDGVYATTNAPFSASETSPSNNGDSRSSGSSSFSGGVIGGIVAAIAVVIGAVAAVIQCVCTKSHHRKQRVYERERDRRYANTSRDLVVQRPADLERAVRS